MQVQVADGPVGDLDAYASIPISFVVRSRLNLENLWLGEFVQTPVEERTKNYDELEPIRTLPQRFDVKNWRMVWAEKNSGDNTFLRISPAAPKTESLIGGALIAWKTDGLDMLERRTDLAVLWDIRVHPLFRGQGLGRALFDSAKRWAKEHGCHELRVETQDTNVDACMFYRRMGCRLHSIKENAYEGLDEAKIIWTISCK